ncbi:MAG: phospholipase D-like domain-containing protein [Ignavibacteria bacterium]
MKIFIFTILLGIFFVSCGKESPFTKKSVEPGIELVENIPVESGMGDSTLRNAKDVWIEMISGAKKNIDIEQYYISSNPGEPMQPVLDSLIKAGERGVKVRILCDARMYNTYPDAMNMLSTKKNIECRVISLGGLTGGIQHSKFIIVDSSVIYFGSQNFDWRSLKHNHEIGLLIKGNEIISSYQDIFEHDWKFAEKNDEYIPFQNTGVILKSYTFTSKQNDSVTVIPTFSPPILIPVDANLDEKQIVRMIYNSKESIMLQFLTYNPEAGDKSYYSVIDSALIVAAKRGIKIKLIVSDWSIGEPSITYLKKLSSHPNIEVKYSLIPDAKEGYIPFARVEQCKYIVSDSTACWIGTGNAEKSYFYNSRDVGALVYNKKISKQLFNIFMKDWNSEYTHQITTNGVYKAREHGEKTP